MLNAMQLFALNNFGHQVSKHRILRGPIEFEDSSGLAYAQYQCTANSSLAHGEQTPSQDKVAHHSKRRMK